MHINRIITLVLENNRVINITRRHDIHSASHRVWSSRLSIMTNHTSALLWYNIPCYSLLVVFRCSLDTVRWVALPFWIGLESRWKPLHSSVFYQKLWIRPHTSDHAWTEPVFPTQAGPIVVASQTLIESTL